MSYNNSFFSVQEKTGYDAKFQYFHTMKSILYADDKTATGDTVTVTTGDTVTVSDDWAKLAELTKAWFHG